MKLFFRKSGEGPPLVILHGLFGSSDNWVTLAKQFAEKNTVYLVDQRNHGQSPHSEIFTYSAMAGDLLELFEDENIHEAIVLGHSMGGKTAMRFAIDYPERVMRLIVVDIGPKYYPIHHREILDALLSVDLSLYKSRNEIDEWLKERIPDTATRQFLLKNIYWQENGRLAWRMNLEIINDNIENVGEELRENPSFNKPTLFIKGEKSGYYISEKDFVDIHRLFSPSIIDVIPGAGHWVQAEAPEEFTASVKAFIKKD